MRLRVLAAMLVASNAAAQETATTTADVASGGPPAPGAIVHFDKPRVWPDSVDERWRLLDAAGRELCKLPCARSIPARSGYNLDGVALFAIHGSPEPNASESLRLSLPEGVGGDTLLPSRVVVRPQRGAPDGAIGLAIVSAIPIALGGGFLLGFATYSCTSSVADGCAGAAAGAAFDLGFGIVLGGLGVIGEGAALVWGLASERPRVELAPLESVPATRGTGVRVQLSPRGLAGTF